MTGKDREHPNKAHKAPRGPAPAPAEVESPLDEAEALQIAVPADALTAVTKERDDLLDRLQRLSAEFLNYQKRAQRDVELARDYANEDLIKSMIAVLDDWERALEVARGSHAPDDPLLAGMELVHDKVMANLGRFGLTVVKSEGKPFDPSQHAALMQQPSDKVPPGTVLSELLKGYRLKDRTIRPAGVIISIAPEAQGEQDSADGGESEGQEAEADAADAADAAEEPAADARQEPQED
jgi:molecular chaperone GrpE